jgi:hypothetical protein
VAYQKASAENRVSNKQWWLISQLLIEGAGIEKPTSAAEASKLIGQLKGTDQGNVVCPGCGEPSSAHKSDCTFAAFVANARKVAA